MALSRTWYTDANVAISDFSSALKVAQSILWGMKALLKGTLSGTNGPDGAPPMGSNWTVEGSSDSSAAGMDSVDRWTDAFDATKLVRNTAGNAHSWIVLKSPDDAGPLYMLIDWSTSADTKVTMRFSYNAFTGGSTTAAPTSTGSWAHSPDGSSDVAVSFNDGTAVDHKLHRVTDADGNFWFLTSKNGSAIFHWLVGMQTLSETRSGDTKTRFSICNFRSSSTGAGGGNPGISDTQGGTLFGGGTRSSDNTNPQGIGGRVYDDSAQHIGCVLIPGMNRQAVNNPVWLFTSGNSGYEMWTGASNASDSKWDFFPFFVFSVNTSKGGCRGRMPDVSLVQTGLTIGAGAPSAAAQERCVVGNIVIPFSVAPSL